jgi:putative transposase
MATFLIKPSVHSRESSRDTTERYLNNVVEHDIGSSNESSGRCGGSRISTARASFLSGIELMHMIKKGQMQCRGETPLSPAKQLYSLVS